MNLLALFSNLLNGVIFILIIALLVFVHELGHFTAAKALGVKVKEFALGFGKKIWSKKHNQTVYRVNIMPLGGYVSLEGEQFEDDAKEDAEGSFQSKPLWAKVIILLAGIFMNIVFAIVLMAGYLIVKDYKLQINYASDYNFIGVQSLQLTRAVYLSEILPNTAASQGGVLQPRDVVIALNGAKITSEDGFRQFLVHNQGKKVVLDVINSQSNKKSVELILGTQGDENKPILGAKYQTLNFQYEISYPKNISASVSHVWNIFAYQTTVLVNSFKLSFQYKDPSYAADQASSIVAIGVIVGQLVNSGQLDEIVNLTALVSISLAFFNLLPLPLLDGGQIVIYTLKSILKKRFNPKVVEVANIVSFVLLVLLSVFLIVRDFIKFEVFSVFFK